MMASMPSPTPPDITSRANPRIAAVVALRDRRERDRQGLTVVDGAREIRRALDAGADVVEVYVCEPRLAGPDARAALDAIERRALIATTVSEPVFQRIAFGERAEGLLAVVRIPDLDLGRLVLSDDPLIVVIEGVEKPGNVGAILRSADGAGVDALIVSSPRTDPFNPNAIRASAGTIFSVPIAVASSEATLDWLRDRGIRPVAARVGAAMPYAEADLRGPLAIVLGTEADGLSAVWTDDAVESVGIPMRGVADSLNVSVSAAVLLYEARRQRDRRTGGAD
jgi:RNA methyltransferase, TrmH family